VFWLLLLQLKIAGAPATTTTFFSADTKFFAETQRGPSVARPTPFTSIRIAE